MWALINADDNSIIEIIPKAKAVNKFFQIYLGVN